MVYTTELECDLNRVSEGFYRTATVFYFVRLYSASLDLDVIAEVVWA